jgi:hypothetical protein
VAKKPLFATLMGSHFDGRPSRICRSDRHQVFDHDDVEMCFRYGRLGLNIDEQRLGARTSNLSLLR